MSDTLIRALLGGALLLSGGTLTAQEALEGRAMLDGAPVSGVEISLHRVTRDTAGVIAVRSSATDGRFSFSLPAGEAEAFQVFFTTADHLGVRHFGPAVHPGEVPPLYVLELYDTLQVASGDSPARVVQRDLIVMQAERGGWEVNEIVRLENPGGRTLVGAGGGPVAEFRVPPGVADFSVGDPDDEVGDLVRMGERVLIVSPLLPGTREVFVRYRLPDNPSTVTLPLDGVGELVNLFVRQPSPELTVRGLEPAGLTQAEGERFLRFSGEGGAPVELSWTSARLPFASPTTIAVVTLGLLLAVGLFFAFRRPPPVTG